jgi:hypothetical protein
MRRRACQGGESSLRLTNPRSDAWKRMKINHEETKDTKISFVLSSCPSFLRG